MLYINAYYVISVADAYQLLATGARSTARREAPLRTGGCWKIIGLYPETSFDDDLLYSVVIILVLLSYMANRY